MRLKTLVVAPIVVFALTVSAPASVEAATVVSEASSASFPYQRWVDRAKTPTPDVTITIAESTAPCESGSDPYMGCTILGDEITVELEVDLAALDARRTFFHELGHVVDAVNLTPAWRGRLTALLHLGGRPWEPRVVEAFADSYAWCAELRSINRSASYPLENASVTGADLARICRAVHHASEFRY